MANMYEVDKSNIVISKEEREDGGVVYKFIYNPDVNFKWSKYRDKILYNKSTKEAYPLKDFIIMRNNTGVLYFYKITEDLDIYKEHAVYKASEWTFEDDVTLKEANMTNELDELRLKIEQLTAVVNKLAELKNLEYQSNVNYKEAEGKLMEDIAKLLPDLKLNSLNLTQGQTSSPVVANNGTVKVKRNF